MRGILYSIRTKLPKLCLCIACGMGLTACDNILDNGYGDCTVESIVKEYRVKFVYDYNMKYADAFPKEVHSVTLYAFDASGKFVYQNTEQGDALAQKDYTMKVDLPAGDYTFITWAGLEGQESFKVPVLTQGQSTPADLTCKMERNPLTNGVDSVGYLKPLWHGKVVTALSRDIVETEMITVPLVKNTNTLRIILQHLSEDMVDVRDYEFTVTDDNGWMAHDNALMKDDTLTYYPYYRAQGSTEVTGSQAPGEEALSMAVAELSIGRLMTDHKPRLTITHKAEPNDTVLSIPLVDYFELCKVMAHYDMSTQEYLDREDEYNMTFFLDKDHHWLKTQVIINNWIVRYNDITPEF